MFCNSGWLQAGKDLCDCGSTTLTMFPLFYHDRGTVFRSNTAGGVIKSMNTATVNVGPNVLFDSNVLVTGANAASGATLGIFSASTWAWYVEIAVER